MSEYISQPVGWVESHIHIHSSCIRHFQMFCFRLIHVNRSLRLNNRNNYCTEAGLSCLTVTGVSAPAHARSSEVSVPSVNCENVETSKAGVAFAPPNTKRKRGKAKKGQEHIIGGTETILGRDGNGIFLTNCCKLY